MDERHWKFTNFKFPIEGYPLASRENSKIETKKNKALLFFVRRFHKPCLLQVYLKSLKVVTLFVDI